MLVLSNFGRMRNLTVDGAVVGRELDPLFPAGGPPDQSYGSIMVVIATDAPLLSSQLSRLRPARRPRPGPGRLPRRLDQRRDHHRLQHRQPHAPYRRSSRSKFLNLKFVADACINPLYEAAIEATEEAVLNAIFCSSGMTGRQGRVAPAIPAEEVLEVLPHPWQRSPEMLVIENDNFSKHNPHWQFTLGPDSYETKDTPKRVEVIKAALAADPALRVHQGPRASPSATSRGCTPTTTTSRPSARASTTRPRRSTPTCSRAQGRGCPSGSTPCGAVSGAPTR